MLSPNDIRAEEDWPASTDPSADSIAPPNTSSAAVQADDARQPDDKIASIADHCHAAD